jgi:membrane associated rhomboid family serine protease
VTKEPLQDLATPKDFSTIEEILDGETPWLDPANTDLFPERDASMSYGVILEPKNGAAPAVERCHDYRDVWQHIMKNNGVRTAWVPQLKFGVPWFMLPGAVNPGFAEVLAKFKNTLGQGALGLGLIFYGLLKLQEPFLFLIGLFMILPVLNEGMSVLSFPRKLTQKQLYERWIKGQLFQIWLGDRSDRAKPHGLHALLGAIVIVYLVQLWKTNGNFNLMLVGINTIMDAGLIKQRVITDGEWWRILTSGMLHGALFHIGFNGMALFNTGKVVLAFSNAWHLAIVFLSSVIGGALMSLALRTGTTPSVGASGGILGVVGYLLYWALAYRDTIPRGFAKLLIRNVILITIMGIIGMNFIDNACHFGGFVTGLAVAAIVRPNQKDWWNAKTSPTIKALGIISFVILTYATIRAIQAML